MQPYSVQKSIFHLALEKRNPCAMIYGKEKKLRFSLTSCSTPSTSNVLPVAMFLVEGECVCQHCPNRLTETDEFFLHSQPFLFLIAISCFSLLIHLLHLLFRSACSFICTDLRFLDTS